MSHPAQQIFLPFYLAEFAGRSFDTRIYIREYSDIQDRLALIAKDVGLPITQSGDVARMCLRLGMQVAEETIANGNWTIDDQPSRYSQLIVERLRVLRERIQELEPTEDVA